MIDSIIFCYWFTTYILLLYGFNLTRKNTMMLSAFIHASLLTTYSAIVLYNYGIDFTRENLFIEIVIAKTSMWYFIYDLFLLLLFDRDIIFIFHHLSAIITFSIILNIGYGISACMLILFMGEITNPIRLAKQMIYPYNKLTYNILNFIFSWMFIIVRCPIMTYYAYFIHKDFYSNIDNPHNKRILYISTSLGLLGGYYWSFLLIKKKLLK